MERLRMGQTAESFGGDRQMLLVVLLAAFGLRLVRLADANIWWDEGLAVWGARQSLEQIARWTSSDVHPPLYFWLLHFWRAAAGDSEFAVRFLSVVFGTLTVVAVWYLARLLLPDHPWIAVTAALFVAVARFAVWWSQETRMYMLAGLLLTLSLAFTVRLRQRLDRRAILGYLIVTTAALWTLYLMAFLLVIEGLYWLWRLRDVSTWSARGRAVLGWAGLQVVTLAAFAPWLLYAVPRMSHWSVQEPFDLLVYAQLYATLLTLGISADVGNYLAPVAVLVALVVAGLVALRLRRQPELDGRPGSALLLALVAMVPPAAVWMVTMLPRSFGYLPKPEARYLLPFAPPFYLLLAWALAALAAQARRARPALWAVLIVAVLGLSGWSLAGHYRDRYLSDDYKSIALTLKAHVQADDLVVLHTADPWPVFAYHWPGSFDSVPSDQGATPQEVESFLAPKWQAHTAIWLVINEDALRVDPQRQFETWLTQHASDHYQWDFGPKRLLLFARTPERASNLLALAPGFAPPAPPQPLADSGLTLIGWEQPLRRVQAGEIAYLAATVLRHGDGGILLVQLGSTPAAQTQVQVPPGDGLVRLPIQVQVPADAPDQRADWRIRLSGGAAVEGQVSILGRPPLAPVQVDPQHPVGATFGNPPQVRLVGYDLGNAASPGGSIQLTLYWEVLATPSTSYKVFIHMGDPAGHTVAQRDDFPLQGTRPTTTWRPGETLSDVYNLSLSPNVRPGTYSLTVGFYVPTGYDRLGPVRDAAGTDQPDAQMVIGAVEIYGP